MHYKQKEKHKYNTELCDDKMTFQDCELAILRHAVDQTDKLQGQKRVNSENIQKILKIVEKFITDKKLICYGGTAINNILPKNAQFYDKEVEIPDYDFFSPNALADAKELADIYYSAGYIDVEAKAGVHMGTFKVFVNFIPIADITHMHKELYKALEKEVIKMAGISYAPPNYLRMAMYLELSRPAGDVSRWEKVLKRLNLLNKYYPLASKDSCYKIDFSDRSVTEIPEQLYIKLRDLFIEQSVVFFGGYAMSLYLRNYVMAKTKRFMANKTPIFDVLAEDPEHCATIILEQLAQSNFKHIKIIKHPAFYEIIPEHVEIRMGKTTLAFIYKPIACHSYNTINIHDQQINIATIDTILTFYLSFIYVNKPYYNKDRLLCMAIVLFDIEQQNRLEQRGLLKRFSINCYGKQNTLEDIRAEKSKKFEELKGHRTSVEYEMWFLKYVPDKLKSKQPTTKLLISVAGDENEHEPDDEDNSKKNNSPNNTTDNTTDNIPSPDSDDKTVKSPTLKQNKGKKEKHNGKHYRGTLKKSSFLSSLFNNSQQDTISDNKRNKSHKKTHKKRTNLHNLLHKKESEFLY